MKKHTDSKSRGFSIVELLVVIAIVTLLAAILFPVVTKIRENAGETAGRAQFGQWAQAFELFRQDYGYYPNFAQADGSITANDLYINRLPSPASGVADFKGDRFYEALTGRVASGSRRGDRLQGPPTNDDGYVAGNTRAAAFYTFAEGEVEEGGTEIIIRDHFGSADVVVLFDRDQNGIIEFGAGGDYTMTTLPEVRSARNLGKTYQPTIGNNPDDEISLNNGIRASVVFYSAGHGNGLLMSWK